MDAAQRQRFEVVFSCLFARSLLNGYWIEWCPKIAVNLKGSTVMNELFLDFDGRLDGVQQMVDEKREDVLNFSL